MKKLNVVALFLVFFALTSSDFGQAKSRKKGNTRTAKTAGTASDSILNQKPISLGVINGKATNLVKPTYPPSAKAVRATGAVNVSVLIDEKGNVISASAVSGHPLLKGAAEEAARLCKFSPTVLSGQARKVTGIIVYNFSPQ
jgi:TonB family protein